VGKDNTLEHGINRNLPVRARPPACGCKASCGFKGKTHRPVSVAVLFPPRRAGTRCN